LLRGDLLPPLAHLRGDLVEHLGAVVLTQDVRECWHPRPFGTFRPLGTREERRGLGGRVEAREAVEGQPHTLHGEHGDQADARACDAGRRSRRWGRRRMQHGVVRRRRRGHGTSRGSEVGEGCNGAPLHPAAWP